MPGAGRGRAVVSRACAMRGRERPGPAGQGTGRGLRSPDPLSWFACPQVPPAGVWGMGTLMCLPLNTHRASQTLSTWIPQTPHSLKCPGMLTCP